MVDLSITGRIKLDIGSSIYFTKVVAYCFQLTLSAIMSSLHGKPADYQGQAE